MNRTFRMFSSLSGALALSVACSATMAQQAQAPTDKADAQSTAVYDTPTGKLTVHSRMPKPASYGPPPSFESLDSNGDHRISHAEASAYPPLANDFLHASGDRDQPINRHQYQRWSNGD